MARRITLVIHALSIGGAERVLALLADWFAEQGDGVTLITLATADSDEMPVNTRVKRVGLDVMRQSANILHAAMNNLNRIRRLRLAIKDSEPTHVVSFTDKMNIVTLLACARLDVPVVIAERSDPRRQRLGRLWERLRKIAYPRCAALVTQTQQVADFLRPLVGEKPVRIIPNAVFDPPNPTNSEGLNSKRRKHVVAVGRLSYEKGFDLLLIAFSQTAQSSDWHLQIVGDGPERESLVELSCRLGIDARVQWVGWTDTPRTFYDTARIFVLPSRYEGFPNALLEAMARGLPAISFDCDSGPRQIIRSEVDGLLVPREDVSAMASAMDRLMSRDDERARLGAAASDVIGRFDRDSFFRSWNAVLDLVAGR